MADDDGILATSVQRGPTLVRWGVRAWLLIGILVAGAMVAWGIGQLSGLLIPMVLALVLGALFAPVVERLAGWRLPRPVGVGIVLIGLVLVVVGSVWLVVVGIVEQGPQIGRQLSAGLSTLSDSLASHGVEVEGGLSGQAGGITQLLRDGLPGIISGVLSSTTSFVMGAVIGVFLLYYMLVDWDGISRWIGSHLGVRAALGQDIVNDSVDAVRRYFWSLTLSAVVTAVLIGGAAYGLGVPLALAIATVTLTTSYVPYLGAIFSGAFATLIALGSNGVGDAVILLVIVLVVQNVVQTVVLAKLSSTALQIHPIATLSSTIIGAALAGIVGATLGTPAWAALTHVHRRLTAAAQATPEDAARAESPEEDTGPPVVG